jgi:NVEALA protein
MEIVKNSNNKYTEKDMKRKIVGVAIVAAIAFVGGWNYNQSKNETKLNDLALANVEALATCETTHGTCWWTSQSYTKCCEGGWYGCSPCD